mmetsp:Transcript_89968/g.226275  ORF Transcript_89968/g.226275 Transcript_89968/m.226275 type:complete len:285 (-) Transcript_89968:2-856(-)
MASIRKLALWWDTEDHGCNQASAHCVEKVAIEKGFEVTKLSSREIAEGKLGTSAFHCFCMGGGELSARQALGLAGFSAIRTFVAGGGGYVGFCLGALMACEKDLHIVNLALMSDGAVFTGCFDDSFCEHHNFGDPEDRTWMVSGHAKLVWSDGAPADDGTVIDEGQSSQGSALEVDARPENVCVSHPPVLTLGSIAPENTGVDILATFAGDQSGIEFLPFGPKCPLTEEQFQSALESMHGQIAVASGKHGCGRVFVTSTHPEMTSGAESAALVAHMLERASSIC